MAFAIATTLLDTLELRADGIITENEIRALKMRWRPRGRLYRTDRDRCLEEQSMLREALPMQVSDEQGKRGLDYLRKLLLTKKGELRSSKLVEGFNLGDSHVRILHTLDHFLFMGFNEDLNHFGEVAAIYPIYRAVSHHGDWFEYIARPWVGGQPTFGGVREELEQ